MSGLGTPNGKRVVALELVLVDAVDVERRIGHDEVEGADGVVEVVVVAVAEADVARQAVEREVHLGERDRDLLLLLAEDGQLPVAEPAWRSTNLAHCTNMPPEPQAGS